MNIENIKKVRHAIADRIEALEAELAASNARISSIEAMAARQAQDAGLWFQTQSASEAYVQRALRKLHVAIEQTDDFGQALTTDTGEAPEEKA